MTTDLTPESLYLELKEMPAHLRMDGGGIYVSAVKTALKHDPKAIDAALVALERADMIVLFPHDDPLRVTPEIAKHALAVPGGVRHFFHFKHKPVAEVSDADEAIAAIAGKGRFDLTPFLS